jgi:SAM-dependent methyltransferase
LSHLQAAPRDGRHWAGPLAAEDRELLARIRPPVLDIGCGPGRHVLALAEQGKIALGIDLTSSVVAFARRRGASVLHRSVFARVPGAGRWSTALLLDGNIGIGADPVGLLRRVATLLAPSGAVVVELDGPGNATTVTTARLELDGVPGPWFPWTQLAVDDLDAIARTSGMSTTALWSAGDRWFAVLRDGVEGVG